MFETQLGYQVTHWLENKEKLAKIKEVDPLFMVM